MARRFTARERLFVVVGGIVATVLGAVLAVLIEDDAPGAAALDQSKRAFRFASEDSPVAAYVERLRAAGEPTTLRDAMERGAPSTGNAALPLRMKALVLFVELELEQGRAGGPKSWPWDGADHPEDETPENFALLVPLLPRLEEFAAGAAAALQASRCRFPFEEADSPESWAKIVPGVDRTVAWARSLASGGDPGAPPESPAEFEGFRNLEARQLIRKALAAVAIASQHEERRLDACRSLLLFGRRDEPAHALDLAADGSMILAAVEALRWGTERRSLPPGPARAALDPLLTGSAFDRLPAALQGELATTLDRYRGLVIAEFDPSRRRLIAPTIVAECQTIESLRAVPRTAFAEYLPRFTAIAERHRTTVGLVSWVRRLARCDAATRLARVALAVAEHRELRGDFPRTLDELDSHFPGGVPLDPFTDAPFLFEQTADGLRIASAGRVAGNPPLDDEELRDAILLWELKR